MLLKTKTGVVITGDIVRSSKLTPARRKKLQTRLNNFIKNTVGLYPDFKAEQFRGDSLQAVFIKNRMAALRTALSLFSYLVIDKFSIRQAIGIGDITYSSRNVVTSDGTAFQLSGPAVDELKKKSELIAIVTQDELSNQEWQVHSSSLNYLLQRLTGPQAEAVYLQLQNVRQEDIARKLKISQPSVHQRLQAAGWPVINSIIQRFETTVGAV